MLSLAKERLAAAMQAASAVQRIFKPRRSEPDRWLNADCPPNPDELAWDIPTLLFKEAARSFSSVVEIGAMDGRRIVAVKRALPNIKAYALDIGAAYGEPQESFGVTFMRHTAENFSILPVGSLVLCLNTLYALDIGSLKKLFNEIAVKSMALFLFESAPISNITRSMPRRGHGGFYHPYKDIAAKFGFRDEIPERLAWRNTGNIKLLEPWRFYFFLRHDLGNIYPACQSSAVLTRSSDPINGCGITRTIALSDIERR